MAFTISYFDGNDEKWDSFILKRSINGTFLQTRNFINYHEPGRFKDCSLYIKKGDEIVAAVLANEICEGSQKIFFAHKGSTFGGISVSESIYTPMQLDEITNEIDTFLIHEGFSGAFFRMVPALYQKKNADMIDYFLVKNGYRTYNELNCYMDLNKYKDDYMLPFTARKRRDCKYALKNNLTFRKMDASKDIPLFHHLLDENLKKYNTHPVHSVDELYDLKFNRLNDRIDFWGVYSKDDLVAASMTFLFDNDILHTQYLCSDQNRLDLFPMDFLILKLIEESLSRNLRILSLGICTEEYGKVLNSGLARFKAGFGVDFCNNRLYERSFV